MQVPKRTRKNTQKRLDMFVLVLVLFYLFLCLSQYVIKQKFP